MKLSTLLSPFIDPISKDSEVKGIHNDSRQIKPGDLFLAYPGAATDGRLYIKKAIESGASAVIYEPIGLPEQVIPETTIPCIPLSGVDKKLAAIATRFYDDPSKSITVTGVTGTNGKTTVAYLLAQAYQLLGQEARYIGTLGEGEINELHPLVNTTPDGLFLQKLFHEYRTSPVRQVCMEVSSHALSLNRVDYIDFNQAIYTNLSHEHLDFHKTLEAYAEAKSKLFVMPSLKSVILNQDDSFCERMASNLPPSCRKFTYGIHGYADVKVTQWELSMTGSEFEIESPWGRHHLQISTLGLFNIYNNLAVFSALLANDCSVEEVVLLLSKLKAAPGRMEVVAKEPCVIVDYAHTPDALENVLQALNKLKKANIITVFGCGGERDKAKRPMMGRIASEYSDLVIITSDNPRSEEPMSIIEGIAVGIDKDTTAIKIPLREEAIQKAISIANRDDIILIAGKGHETYQQIGNQRLVFSDQAVVQKIMKS
ncbi:UDP-N-acetylmuramoyl-L-alanyl-D-glutamate--2,6-diaminopimelate ligase [Legionella impletisoli]|uniref:UDP-N-acetylmuramoyl-L-alanyl-D-glutamate--2,6-diaminopimelate ligase n=1 Tax=Legionella impletisoli TaxID=343510 RepID=A0A917N9H8_9GAMM|nr:UDP-N-acetylmuramoyl-L-alanyl-D-glutamate--2,6-diaminopimelate ligase [Legionella impletisoli]GGI79757.1 UDP-N-acetylmuramoyl-L-alanyl-D-glutamate--2,6-diaminopimelate ligase [Legionella impletisoli]